LRGNELRGAFLVFCWKDSRFEMCALCFAEIQPGHSTPRNAKCTAIAALWHGRGRTFFLYRRTRLASPRSIIDLVLVPWFFIVVCIYFRTTH
jgi:hypothetical protein